MAGGKSKPVGTSDLAAMLGISRQRVNELGRVGKITREADGKWDPDKVREALGRNLDGSQAKRVRLEAEKPKAKANLPKPDEPPPGTLLYEQWRLTREKADREELDRKVLGGALLKRDEVRRAVSTMISASKSCLVTMPDELCDRLAVETDPIRCREMVSEKVNEALSQLAEYPAHT